MNAMNPVQSLAMMLASPSSSMQSQQLAQQREQMELQRWIAQQQGRDRSSANKWGALSNIAGGIIGGMMM